MRWARPRARLFVACLTGTTLAAAFAAPAHAADTVVEAESMKIHDRKAVKVVSDSLASGGKKLTYWLNGRASLEKSTGDLAGITLRVRGDQCQGSPVMVVKLNGAELLRTTVAETSFVNKAISVSAKAGVQRVEVSFANNLYVSSTCDRNLHLDRVVLQQAPTPEPEPAPAPAPDDSTWAPTWSGAFEPRDLSEYYQVLKTSAGPEPGTRITFDTANLLTGSSATRFELRPGDAHSDGSNRIQLRGINYGNHYFNEGEDWYFRWAMYIDPSTTVGSSISNPWRNVVAWPSVQDGAFSPLKYFVHRESGGGANPSGTDSITMAGDLGVSGAWDKTQWKVPVVKGQWYEFITHWKFSSDPAVGLVEHWMRAPGETGFTKQSFMDGSNAMRMKTLSGAGAQANLRLGIYRNKAFTTVDKISFDEVYMGPTLSSVLR